MPKLGIATSETHTRPHFASHTQSSLMKRRTPMKSKQNSSSSMKDVSGLKRPQGNVILRSSGIHKKRSNIVKQSRSMQMMIMILKQQRDRRATVFLTDSELIKTCRSENPLISLRSDLIKDVSDDLKKCAGSPAKLANRTLRGELTKVVDESEKHADNSHASQGETNCTGRDHSESISVSSEDRTIVDVAYKLQLHLSDEEEPADSRCEVEVHRRGTESGEKPNDFPKEDCSEIETQIHPQNANAATNRKRTRKFWTNRRTGNERVDVDRARRTDLQNSKSTKHIDNPRDNSSANDKLAMNGNVIARRKGALQRNVASNQRAWKPPGVSKTWATESATSLQPISQKSSQSTEKSTASSRNKHSSSEHVEASNSESTSSSTSANQSKMLMKENRDPRANRMMKICEHLAETKQRQRLQSGGTLPKKRWSRTKIGTKFVDKRDDANPTLSKSKSRHCQTRPIVLKESSNNSNVEQHTASTLTRGKRARTMEVIHTLRKIINDSAREDEDAEENAVNDFDHEKDDNEIETSPNHDTSLQNNELHMFTKDVNLDEADQPSRRSICTQTELHLPSDQEIDAEEDQDLKEILKLTRIVATQTSPCNRNVVEIGCNTSNVVYNDVEVSCDLMDFINSKTEVDPATIEDKSTLDGPIHTEPSCDLIDLTSSVTEIDTGTIEGESTLDGLIHTEYSPLKHIEINVESENTNENRELPLNGCKETLNTQMSVKLENYDSMEIAAKTTNDAAREVEKIIQEEAYQISLNLLENSDDKTDTDNDKQESTKCSNNHGASSTSVNNLSLTRSPSLTIDDCNVSHHSSEDITKYSENDVQDEDTVTSELKVDGIPSDVMAAFELAAERARNLHEAVIIYHRNLTSKESGKRNEKTDEDYEMSEFRDDRHCPGIHTPFTSRENEDKMKLKCEAMCHLANNGEDFDGFSTYSSRGSTSDRICDFESFSRSSKEDYFGIDQEEENNVLSENKRARSTLNESSDSDDTEYLIQILKEIQSRRNRSNENFGTKGAINKTLALPVAIKETCLISRENLISFIYCIVCTVVFWFLQFSFRCDSTK
ncbi:uncharacterized protein [Temnothorax longispinosus]|uniref:uncharacterized protein n=1 Tax=Temnothorax longispinosus TaxID=300112 RepID=UPI003A99FA38